MIDRIRDIMVGIILMITMLIVAPVSNEVYASWLPLTQDFNPRLVMTTKKKVIYDLEGKKIGTAYKGSSFLMIDSGSDGKWIEITDGDHRGYIKKSNVIDGEMFYDYFSNHQNTCTYEIHMVGNKPKAIKCYKNKSLSKYVNTIPSAVLTDKEKVVAVAFNYTWVKIKVSKKKYYYISPFDVELVPIYKKTDWKDIQ